MADNIQTEPVWDRSQNNAFMLREGLRKGDLYAIIDAVSQPGLPQLLKEVSRKTGQPYSCLYSGSAEQIKGHDAPWLIKADKEVLRFISKQVQLNDDPDWGFLFRSKAKFEKLRQHWKKWLYVMTEGDDPMEKKLFRYYDPRILAAFLVVLTPLEARAFSGPISSVLIPAGEKISSFVPVQEVATLAMPKWPVGSSFVIRDRHYQAVSEVKGKTFEDRYFKYAREVWGPELKDVSDDELRDRIRSAIADAKKMGPAREDDIKRIALIYMLWPEFMKDEAVWKEVYEGDGRNPIANPYQRSGRFLLKAVASNVPDQETADEIWNKKQKFTAERY